MGSPDDHDQQEDFATMLAEFEKEGAGPGRRVRVGETVRGRVISIGQEALFVDLGGKAEGMIDLVELRDASGALTVGVGDAVEARVVDTGGPGGCVVLRRTLGRGPEARAELEQAFSLGVPVEGTVTGVNKGGLEVQIAGVRGFCPLSQIDLRHVEDAAAWVGQKLQFRITKYEATRGRSANVVVSRRALLEEEAAAKARETRARLEVGAVLPGTVTTIKDYGAFIDLGGLEGMLHVSELGFSRVARPGDVLAVGQTIEVQVLKIERTDDPKRPERISLSLKSLERDPWLDVPERFPEGTRVRGTVVRVEAFGAFVELAPGVEGLVHVSELGAARRVRHAREAARVGQPLEVTVLAVDRDKHRLSLGIAGADGDEDDALPPPSPGDAGGGTFGTLGDLLRKKR